jgi:hypothetical protein
MSEAVVAHPYDLLMESINENEEVTDMGSFNHSSVQANITLIRRLFSIRRPLLLAGRSCH